MELKIIIYSALLVAGALAICFVIFATLIILLISPLKNLKEFLQWVKEKWINTPAWCRSILIVLGSIAFAIIFIYAYNGYYYFTSNVSPDEKHLYKEALSNIRRNTMLFIFAIMGICLAIWARVANEKQLRQTQQQLKFTGEQIANSAEINRNDRFAKATEMLSDSENRISLRGGLYILQDLINESPKTEYIRCVEIISYWMISYFVIEHEKEIIDMHLLNAVAKILKMRSSNKKLEYIIKRYKKDNNLIYWPTLKSVNLQDAFLWHANLRDAFLQNVELQKADLKKVNLQGAVLQFASLQYANLEFANLKDTTLEGANLTNAKMKGVKNLTKEQVLSTKWEDDDGNGKPPELPDDLMNDPDIKVWLNNPADKEA